jgi:hypothetical protein
MKKVKSINAALDLLNQKLSELDELYYPVFLNRHQNGSQHYQLSDYFQSVLSKDKTKIKLLIIDHELTSDLPDLILICNSLSAQYLGNCEIE